MHRLNKNHKNYPNLIKTVKDAIYEKRTTLNISQSFLAETCDITRNCIQQLECSEHIPDLTTLFKIFEALGFSESEFSEFMTDARQAFRADVKLQKEMIDLLRYSAVETKNSELIAFVTV